MRSYEEIRGAVEARYAKIAKSGASCCGNQTCGQIGYSADDIASLPAEALTGLGCGNPIQVAGIREGDTVVDLGSGGGIDVFLAARQVGLSGRVIGVDMTPDMLARARTTAKSIGIENVEFRQGLIESLPVTDSSADVILSNCVINLSPDKVAVFRDALRVLKPGGRLVVSDMVADGTLPAEIRENPERWASCIGGALSEEEYLEAIREAGFVSVSVLTRNRREMAQVYSVTVWAEKPSTAE